MSLSARAIALQGIGFGPRVVALQGFADAAVLTQYEPKSEGAGGPGRKHYFERTSRNSDADAYNRERVAERLEAVVINGKAYDPFTPGLIDILEAAAKEPLPENLPEVERQELKLARTFRVMTEKRMVEVPLFRPMLPEVPNFAKALYEDFEAYAARAREEAAEERRRILILLTSSDWP